MRFNTSTGKVLTFCDKCGQCLNIKNCRCKNEVLSMQEDSGEQDLQQLSEKSRVWVVIFFVVLIFDLWLFFKYMN